MKRIVILVISTICTAAVKGLYMILSVNLLFSFTDSRKRFVMAEESDNGLFTVYIYEIGSAEFFSANDCSAELEKNGEICDSCNFQVANDGGSLNSGNFSISFGEDHVMVTANGSEQNEENHYLYSD